MARNMLVQLFLDPGQYENVLEAVRTRKISYKNDSDMIRKVLYDYTEKIADIVITSVAIESKTIALKQQIAAKDSLIDQLRGNLNEKNKEIEILTTNINIRKKENRKEKHERKNKKS